MPKIEQVLDDELGHHVHYAFGNPYDHNKKITCEMCIKSVLKQRDGLCRKYGWETWPQSLTGSLEGE